MVNSNTIQLCTVNAVFFKSLIIADELETEYIIPTFDLAFYAKAQQVRWNDDVSMQRTIVRLGESKAASHFSASLESVSKI